MFQLLDIIFSKLLFFALYFESSSSFPQPLSKKEEEEAFRQFREEGDEKAREKLIEHNLRLVAHIVKKYNQNANEQDDLISVGTVGLIKAVASFSNTRGTRFATYGSKCIENEILMHFRSQKKTEKDVSLHEPLDTDSEGNTLSLIDLLSDDTDIIDCIDKTMKLEKLHGFITQRLSSRERSIMILRYGLCNCRPLTQREVAGILNISRSYVYKIAYYKWMKNRKITAIIHFFILRYRTSNPMLNVF